MRPRGFFFDSIGDFVIGRLSLCVAAIDLSA
jgi:hypothetical protein